MSCRMRNIAIADQEFSREMFMEQDKIAIVIKIKCTPADCDE